MNHEVDETLQISIKAFRQITCRLFRVGCFAETEHQRGLDGVQIFVKLRVTLIRCRSYIVAELVDVVAISFRCQFDEFVERLNSQEQANTKSLRIVC